jgi:hypothetical protein
MRLNISIEDALLKKVDWYCEENSYNRSELIAELLRHRIMGVDITNPKKAMEIPTPAGDVIESPKKGPVVGWCQINLSHPFQKGKNFPIKLITWEDENGALVVDKKWACEGCILYYRDIGRGSLTVHE